MFMEFTSVLNYISEDGLFGFLDVSLLLHSLSVTIMFLKNFIASTVLALTAINVVEAKYGLAPVKTGVNAQTGARPFRRNILDLQNDAPAW
jgi:energy-converting hydrogenase Eha subunit B